MEVNAIMVLLLLLIPALLAERGQFSLDRDMPHPLYALLIERVLANGA